MAHPTSIAPHPDCVDYTRIEMEAGIDFDALDTTKLYAGSQTRMYRPRSLLVTDTGLGTLIVTTDAGNQRVIHGLTAGKFLEPSPLVLSGIVAATTPTDVSKFITVDDDTQLSTFTGWVDDTTDANDAGTADFLFMPATEAANADGFLIGMAEPFNALDLVLSTAGVGGVITYSVYTGDRTTYDGTFTAVSAYEGAAKNLLASGEVSWQVPAGWKPCNIGSYGDLYWLYGEVTTVFTTNPAGTNVQAKNKTTVGGIRVAP